MYAYAPFHEITCSKLSTKLANILQCDHWNGFAFITDVPPRLLKSFGN